MTVRILLAGGGTAGHVVPSLATASALLELRPDVEIAFVGTEAGLEHELVPAAGWALHTVRALPLRRRLSVDTLRAPAVVWAASTVVGRIIDERDVHVACTFGGYVSGPLALGARRRRLPLVVHEQNAVPGLANRLAARWALAVAASVPGTEARFPHPERVTVTGNPVRPELARGDLGGRRDAARRAFDLEADRFTLLAFGGSLGARRINEALLGSAGLWRDPDRLQILHLTGRRDHDSVQQRWTGARGAPLIRCVPFVDRMDLAYAVADLALCRSGASTVAELTAVGLSSILVPYPHAAADEQTANARALAAAGAATVVEDSELSPRRLVELVESCADDADRRQAAREAARRLGRPDAAESVARLVLRAAESPGRPR